MKKRLTFLLAAMVFAMCSFAETFQVQQTAKWGDWAISQDGTLHINFQPRENGMWQPADMPDYGNGGAPWHDYADIITAVDVNGYPLCIGKHWFQDLCHVTKFDMWQDKLTDGIGDGAFENFGTPDMQLVFPNLRIIYKWGLAKTNVSAIVLPSIEEVREYGLAYNQNLYALVLGPNINFMKRGSMAYNPNLCLSSMSGEPTVFMMGYAPPTFKTGYDKTWWQKIKDWFAEVFSTGEKVFQGIKEAEVILDPIAGLADSTFGTNLAGSMHDGIAQLHTFENEVMDEAKAFSDEYHLKEWADLGKAYGNKLGIFNKQSDDDAEWLPPFGELVEGTPYIGIPFGSMTIFASNYSTKQDKAEYGYYARNQVETEKPDFYNGAESGTRCYSQGKFMEAVPILDTRDSHFIGWYTLSDNNLVVSINDSTYSRTSLKAIVEWMEGNSDIAPGSLNLIFSRSTSRIAAYSFEGCTKIGSVWTFCPNVLIDNLAFYGCPNLKNVSIQGEDAVINEAAFGSCEKLAEVEFGGKKIGARAFSGSVMTSLKMPNVEAIGEEAFQLAELHIAEAKDTVLFELPKLKQISFAAFGPFKIIAPNARAIKLRLPVLHSIAESAFYGSSFTHVELPNTQYIYKKAFYNCKDLKEVHAERLFYLEKDAFSVKDATSNLQHWYSNREAPVDDDRSNPFVNRNLSSAKLHVPMSKESSYKTDEWWKAFQRVTDVNDFPITGNGWELSADGVLTISANDATGYKTYSSYIHSVVVNCDEVPASMVWKMKVDKVEMKSVKKIGAHAFELALVKEFTLPETLEEIEGCAFQDMQAGSRTITRIPNSVKKIGEYAFSGMKISNIELGEGVEEIGRRAFMGCDIQTLKMKSNITKIGEEAFLNNPLNCVEIAAETPPTLSKNVFNKNMNIYLNMPETAWIPYVSSDWKDYFKFRNDTHGEVLHSGIFAYPSTRFVHFDDGVLIVSGNFGGGETIVLAEDNNYVNGWKNDVKEVILMGTISSLYSMFSTADPPFMNMPNLEKVTLTEDMKSLTEYSFANCPKLKTINLDNVEKIGDYAFDGCASLENISLASVNDEIGEAAFRGCASLTEVYLPISVSIGPNAFANCTSLERFKAKTILGADANSNLFGKAAPVSKGAFNNCSKLAEFQMEPAYLSDSCFVGCSSLKKLTIGNAIGLLSNQGFLGDIFSGTGLDADDAEGIFISRPTPPDFGTPLSIISEQVVSGWGNLNPSKIKVHVPKAWIETYRNWDYWKETNLMEDEEYANFEGLPTGGIYDKNGTWDLDANGKLTIRYQGDMSQGEMRPDIPMIYAPYIKSIVYTDGAKVIGGPLGANNLTTLILTAFFLNVTHLDNFSTIVMGSDVESLPVLAFNYVPVKQLKDIYIAAPKAPNCDYEENFQGTDFFYPAAEYGPLPVSTDPAERAQQLGKIRCHVSSAPGVLESYQNTDFWKELDLIDDFEDFEDIAEGDHSLDIPEYNVVFTDFDGKILSEQTVLKYESAVAPEEPTREGFRFTGWSVEFECIVSDLEIEAQYVELDGLENVTVKGKDGRYLINGQLYIITPDGAVYNAAGMRVK